MTPAVKLLEAHSIDFALHHYQHDPRAESYGLEAAEKLGIDAATVFKTLMLELSDGGYAVAVVPVQHQLSLKKLAAITGSKKAQMAKPNDVQRNTGYVLGGVSPLGQSRSWPTVIDASAEALSRMYISAGKRGLEIALTPQALQAACNAKFAEIAAQ